MAAFVVVALMKSVPMVYNGQEVGTPYRLTFPFTSTKINWALNPGITAEYKRILAFRNGSMAARRGTLTSYDNADVCAFTKEVTGEKILVIDNLRNSVITFTIPAALAGTTWQDALNGGSVTLPAQLSLEPYSYLIAKQ